MVARLGVDRQGALRRSLAIAHCLRLTRKKQSVRAARRTDRSPGPSNSSVAAAVSNWRWSAHRGSEARTKIIQKNKPRTQAKKCIIHAQNAHYIEDQQLSVIQKGGVCWVPSKRTADDKHRNEPHIYLCMIRSILEISHQGVPILGLVLMISLRVSVGMGQWQVVGGYATHRRTRRLLNIPLKVCVEARVGQWNSTSGHLVCHRCP